MAQNGIIDRENELKKNFISAVKEVFGLEIKEEDYEKISAEKFVSLKKALRNINNIVTLKVTNLFIDKLKDAKIIEEPQAKAMKDDVNSISANANGYDVEYPNPKGTNVLVDKPINILAEVKCNIPVGKTQFGSAQKAGILKDIEGLLNGEEKSKSSLSTTKDYFKFMVFMDYTEDGCDVKKSVNELLTPYKEKVIITSDKVKDVDKDHVYIIYI